MKTIRLVILIYLIISCSHEETINIVSEKSIKSVSICDSSSFSNKDVSWCNLATDSISSLVLMNQAGIEFPEIIQKKGELIDGASWTDAIGLNYIQVYNIENGEFFEENYNSELHVYHHVKCMKEDEFTEYWHVKDFGGEVYRSVNYWPHSLKISDIDNDGAAETEFFYAIQPDGLDMSDLKFMFHTRGVKMPIRGGFYYGNEGIEVSFVNPDSVLQSYPVFLEYATSRWENWVDIESNRE